jgi:hypothetical protein
MDSMDNFRERLEALEHQTYTLARQARWWRGIACGVMLLALVSMPLQSGKAADTQPGTMADRMAAMEHKLSAMAFNDAANEVVITGANLRIVHGLGSTNTTNGLGNLIVGYNEERGDGTDNRTGSHNVVVGSQNNFSSFGGLVVGAFNEIGGPLASVSGGRANTASGDFSSVSGGAGNKAIGNGSSVSGGDTNTAGGFFSSVSGGEGNVASGNFSSVSGGSSNTAFGEAASVSSGANRTAPGTDNWAAGALFSDN